MARWASASPRQCLGKAAAAAEAVVGRGISAVRGSLVSNEARAATLRELHVPCVQVFHAGRHWPMRQWCT